MSKTAAETPSNGTAAEPPMNPANSAESLDDILGIEDRPIVPFFVPEWNKWVHLRVLGGEEYEGVNKSVVSRDEEGKATTHHEKYRIALVSACLVNSKGARIVVGDEARKKLNTKGSPALQRLYEKCAEINVASKAAYEELKGNSESDTSTASLAA